MLRNVFSVCVDQKNLSKGLLLVRLGQIFGGAVDDEDDVAQGEIGRDWTFEFHRSLVAKSDRLWCQLRFRGDVPAVERPADQELAQTLRFLLGGARVIAGAEDRIAAGELARDLGLFPGRTVSLPANSWEMVEADGSTYTHLRHGADGWSVQRVVGRWIPEAERRGHPTLFFALLEYARLSGVELHAG